MSMVICDKCRNMFDEWPNPICPHCGTSAAAQANALQRVIERNIAANQKSQKEFLTRVTVGIAAVFVIGMLVFVVTSGPKNSISNAMPSPRTGNVGNSFEQQMNESNYDQRVKVWADQFGRSEAWVREHTDPTDSAAQGNSKLVGGRLRE